MVAMLYSYVYRLYPNRQQTLGLESLLERHRELYNAALEERREAWRRARVSLNYFDQANQLKAIRTLRLDVAALNYSACQQTLRRLDKAYQSFFRRVRSGDTPGYPRFKSRNRFNSEFVKITCGYWIRVQTIPLVNSDLLVSRFRSLFLPGLGISG
jgi:putative transposase